MRFGTWQGSIEYDETKGNYTVKGSYEVNHNSIVITELPVRTWTGPYKEMLEDMLVEKEGGFISVHAHTHTFTIHSLHSQRTHSQNPISLSLSCGLVLGFGQDIRDNSTEDTVKLTTVFSVDNMAKVEAVGIEKKLKLANAKFSLGNMNLFDPEHKIKKYDTVEQIMEEFFHLRLRYYQKRKVRQC